MCVHSLPVAFSPMQASVQTSAVFGDRVAVALEVEAGEGVAEVAAGETVPPAGGAVVGRGAEVAGVAVAPAAGDRVGTRASEDGLGVARSAGGFQEGEDAGAAGEEGGGEGVGAKSVAGAADDDEAEGPGAALKGDAVVLDEVGCNAGAGVTGGGDSTGAAVNRKATGGVVAPAVGADTGRLVGVLDTGGETG